MIDTIIKRFEQPDEVREMAVLHPPVPHDSWVVGREPYVSLHFMGADRYAR